VTIVIILAAVCKNVLSLSKETTPNVTLFVVSVVPHWVYVTSADKDFRSMQFFCS